MLQDLSSDPDYDADSESILPLFEDRLGYGIEEEDYEESTCLEMAEISLIQLY